MKKLSFILAFRYFNEIDARTDQCDGDHLIPAETVLTDGKGDDGGNNQYNVAVEGNQRSTQIFQAYRNE